MELNDKVYKDAISYVASIITSKGNKSQDPRDIVHDAMLITTDFDFASLKKAINNVLNKTALSTKIGTTVSLDDPIKIIQKGAENELFPCRTCGESLPGSEFVIFTDNKKNIRRMHSECRTCMTRRTLKYNKDNQLYYRWYLNRYMERKSKQKSRIKELYKKCGKKISDCKNCGSLLITKFSLHYNKRLQKYYVNSYCTDCVREKRKTEWKKPRSYYKNTEELRERNSRNAKAAREKLSDSYIKDLLRHMGYAKEDITNRLITKHRKSIIEKKYELSIPYYERPSYIRKMLSNKIPTELITPEMIAEKIVQLKEKRRRLNRQMPEKQNKNTNMAKKPKKAPKPKPTTDDGVLDEMVDITDESLHHEPENDSQEEDD